MAVIRQTKHYYKEYFQIQRGAFYHYKSFNTVERYIIINTCVPDNEL